MAKEFENVESFAELKEDRFDTIQAEYNELVNDLTQARRRLANSNNPLEKTRARRRLTEIEVAIGELKPHLKVERREIFNGKMPGQRTRHDVMEDMLTELREIKTLLLSAVAKAESECAK